MKNTSLLQEQLILKNQEEYQVKYNYLRFITHAEAEVATQERNRLLTSLASFTQTGYKGSKLDITSLSPGCRICGEGTWSCLFINGICNSRCFYCPAPQHEIHDPETNTLLFPDASDYIDYLKTFNFRGMSISGGEPFLTFEKSLDFITKARKEIGEGLYIWLYTNGKLFDREKAAMLADAGLNEIRFDIGATGYNTDKVAQAVGIIPNVTVEIPAIPEDLELLKMKMKELSSMGISFLNLHQLRLTPFNFNRLIEHDYTFLHGEKVTILESELTALKLLLYSKEEKIDLPVNYCSFVYKNRYQKSAARKRHALKMLKPGESITEMGFIRRLAFIPDSMPEADKILKLIPDEGTPAVFVDGEVLIAPEDLHFMRSLQGTFKLEYYVAQLAPQQSGMSEFKPIELNSNRKIGLERSLAQPEISFTRDEAEQFFKYLKGIDRPFVSAERKWASFVRFENIEEGLQLYY